MKTGFIIITIIGLYYFFIVKRRVDFFTIGFVSAVVYFLPGFYGYAYKRSAYNIKSYLIDETYMVMSVLLIVIILGGIIFDISFKEKKIRRIADMERVAIITTMVAVISLIATVYSVGPALFQDNKLEMLDNINLWHTFMVSSASLAVVISFNTKSWKLFLIAILVLLFNTYIGFRSATAYTVIALFILYFSSHGKQRLLIHNFKSIVVGSIFALFFFNYKTVYTLVKIGEYNEAISTFFSLDNLIDSIRYSEPFTTQMILNEIIIADYKVGLNHFKDAFVQVVLPIGKNTLTGDNIEIISFSDMFGRDVFQGRTNIASNFWAEFWSSGGWPLLIAIMIIFVGALYLGSYLLYTFNAEFQSLVALVTSVSAFYIHRNTIVYHLKLSQQFILMFCLCAIISYILARLGTSKKIRNDN